MIKSNMTVFDEGESPYEAMDHIEWNFQIINSVSLREYAFDTNMHSE